MLYFANLCYVALIHSYLNPDSQSGEFIQILFSQQQHFDLKVCTKIVKTLFVIT